MKVETNAYAKTKIITLSVSDLKPAEYNSRLITQSALEGLANSMETLGLLALPIVNKRKDGYRIVGGHQRVKVLVESGVSEVQCIVVEFDDATEHKANFALNNRAIQGDFVPEMTRALLEEIRGKLESYTPELFSEMRFDDLLRQIRKNNKPTEGVDDVERGGNTDDDAETALPKTAPASKVGTFYKLGNHVVLCHKVAGAVSLHGFPVDTVSMAFTQIAGKSGVTQSYVDAFLNNLLTIVPGALYIPTNFVTLPLLHRRFLALGGHWSNTLLWHAPRGGDPATAYRDAALPVLYGWKEGQHHYHCGSRDQGNVFRLKRPPKSDLPVEVATRCILNSSKAGESVLDLDLGSGSTLIAAEKTGRHLIGYAGSARDCDAVRKRWSEFTQPAGTDWRTATPNL